jgi:hypothetical protein
MEVTLQDKLKDSKLLFLFWARVVSLILDSSSKVQCTSWHWFPLPWEVNRDLDMSWSLNILHARSLRLCLYRLCVLRILQDHRWVCVLPFACFISFTVARFGRLLAYGALKFYFVAATIELYSSYSILFRPLIRVHFEGLHVGHFCFAEPTFWTPLFVGSGFGSFKNSCWLHGMSNFCVQVVQVAVATTTDSALRYLMEHRALNTIQGGGCSLAVRINRS